MKVDAPEGWRWVYQRWHYFRDGSSLCNKFAVLIIGGGRPRKPWPLELPDDEAACDICKSNVEGR
jgi:hypothetical protein